MPHRLPIGRTLVVAPHPDDEAIAAGGLIQRVIAAGSVVSVVLVTDGENNPWPQRYQERKWFITTSDRQRWGAMRRTEALASLAVLGVESENARFLQFPDQAIMSLARRGDDRLLAAFRDLLRTFRPTLVVSPSALDLHADHRAISWYVRSAVRDVEAELPIAITTYIVHGGAPESDLLSRIELSECEMMRKREAIECHRSQLLLSRERFLAHARRTESFYKADPSVGTVESAATTLLTSIRHSALVVLGRPRREPENVETFPADDARTRHV